MNTQTSAVPEFISIEDLARKMQKSTAWVYANAAKLGGVKIGGSWVFTADNLREALKPQPLPAPVSRRRRKKAVVVPLSKLR